MDDKTARAEREAHAYDEGGVWANANRWNQRVIHVIECENTQRVERRMTALMELSRGASALDVGCADGGVSKQLHDLGAVDVLGIDVSAGEIEVARERFDHLTGVRFEVASADEPLEGEFALIVGRSVLHHIDFRTTLERFYTDNLAPGGHMVFMEPTSHPLVIGFHRFARSAHTDDEWPLTPADIGWMKAQFPIVSVEPVNILSFPAAIVSSMLLPSADNALMRAADEIDRRLARRPAFRSRGRQGLFHIVKPC